MRYLLVYFFSACAYVPGPDCGPTVKAWTSSLARCEQVAATLHKEGLTTGWICVRLSDEMIDFVPLLEMDK